MDVDRLKDNEHLGHHLLPERMNERFPLPTEDWFTTSLASHQPITTDMSGVLLGLLMLGRCRHCIP